MLGREEAEITRVTTNLVRNRLAVARNHRDVARLSLLLD